MSQLLPCPCGKPVGMMRSSCAGETIYQVCCSDWKCPLLKTYTDESEGSAVWNKMMGDYNKQDVQGLIEALVELIAAVKCSDGGAAGMEDVSAAITSATLALKSYQEGGL